MKKKVLSALLAILMLLTLVVPAVATRPAEELADVVVTSEHAIEPRATEGRANFTGSHSIRNTRVMQARVTTLNSGIWIRVASSCGAAHSLWGTATINIFPRNPQSGNTIIGEAHTTAWGTNGAPRSGTLIMWA